MRFSYSDEFHKILTMCNLSENYHLRECYLKQDVVPTQSVIKKNMGPLADVFFKSLCPRRKKLVGLEPPLKGGGNDWYVTPEDLLKGRAVLKPVKKEVLTKLTHQGIDLIGTKLFQKRRKDMEKETEVALIEADILWRNSVTSTSKQLKEDLSDHYSKGLTTHMSDTYQDFARLYRKSLDAIENMFHESAIADIKKTRENAIQIMQSKYMEYLKHQATMLHNDYENKLMEEKAKLRAEFEQKLEIARSNMADTIHDVNVDKHVSIENLKQYLKRQNLACLIYVALKEREMCLAEMEESKHKHKKKAKILAEKITIKDFEIHMTQQKERRRQDFLAQWQKKVSSVVKQFQNFVTHCLITLPEHAEFFINMEKLMLLQINDTLENPTAESIIAVEEEPLHTPVPQAKPFYLFCDTGYKAKLDQELCPKHTGTASTAQLLPAIIINKRCLYAACDNFEQFSNRIKAYIHGYVGNEEIDDDRIYEQLQRFKYTSSDQQLELKLESSLMQVLQEEIDYMKQVPFKCTYCKMPLCTCTCTPCSSVSTDSYTDIVSAKPSIHVTPSQLKSIELMHEREPKWESYLEYVKPTRCSCGKTARKHLEQQLPAYMRKMKYDPPELPEYEMCSVTMLKELVEKARKVAPIPKVVVPPEIQKDMSTQYLEPAYEYICTCISNSEIGRMPHYTDSKLLDRSWIDKNRLVGEDVSPTFMTQELSEFATARALSLRNLVTDMPDLKDIFNKKEVNLK